MHEERNSTSKARLSDLLSSPREALDVEFKEWLTLDDADHKATIAKEIIALANHGGGYLIIGYGEGDDGSISPSPSRPSSLQAFSQDCIHSIVSKYLDPAIQCSVFHEDAPGAAGKFPVIVVPGGHRIPIRAKAGSPDGKKLVANRTYIRRPGPSSEEPRTAEEWDRLLERCLQNRQAELLSAMRSIMAGIVPGSESRAPSVEEELRAFAKEASDRWERRVAALPQGASPRFPHGYYDFAAAIDGSFDRVPLANLRRIVGDVRNYSGWPAFLTLNGNPYAPSIVDGAIEFWCGPDSDGTYDRPAHHDFWRASSEGRFFTRRGYQEDGGFGDRPPGTSFDISSPTWRLGEAILAVSQFARALNAADAHILIECRWEKLRGRELVAIGNSSRWIRKGRKAAQDSYSSVQAVALGSLPQSLPEVVYAILRPLYELFDFLEISKRLVEEELSELQRHVF